MNLDDMKPLWQSPDDGSGPGEPGPELVARVARDAAAFDRTIRRRDRIETIAALLVALLFIPVLLGPSWVSRAGALLVIGAAAFIYHRLRRARLAAPRPDPAGSLAEALRADLARLDAQIRLLETVLWWYVTPLVIGIILTFAGQVGLAPATFVYAAVVILLGAAVYQLNQLAVRRHLRPRRDSITHMLERIDE